MDNQILQKNMPVAILWRASALEICSEIKEIDSKKMFKEKSSLGVAFLLHEQKITAQEVDLLEKNQWLIFEVPKSFNDVTLIELQKYFNSQIDEVHMQIKEQNSINPPNNIIKKERKYTPIKEDTLESFLNIGKEFLKES